MGVGLLPLFRRLAPSFPISGGLQALRRARGLLSALGRQALEERDRWPLWLPVAFGTGIAGYFALSFEPSPAWAGLAFAATVASVFGVAGSERAIVRATLSLLAAAAFGFGVAKLRTADVSAPVLSHRIGPLGIEGRVEQSELHGRGIRVVLGDLRSRQLLPDSVPARVRVSIRTQTILPQPGSWIHVTTVLMPPPSPTSPGAYDFGRAAYYLRLGAVGYAFGRPIVVQAAREPGWRDRCKSRVGPQSRLRFKWFA